MSKPRTEGSSAIAETNDPLPRAEIVKLRRRLRHWYARHGRTLPWRATRDPYRIWLSEIMLQQTTVKGVLPFYEKFLTRFPDIHSLASATEEDVLQYWEGLGYYSRARNLRRAAQQVCEQFAGQVPTDLAALQSLPGIGRYSAGAIRSFAFDLPGPIVEANTQRLYCRLLAYAGDPRSREGQNLLWEFATHLQPTRGAGGVNQALIELGGTVCTPQEPACARCPLTSHCQAFQNGLQATIPVKASRPGLTPVVEASVAIESEGRWLIRQRGASERWSGMWDFPRFTIDNVAFDAALNKRAQAQVRKQLVKSLIENLGLFVEAPQIVTEIRHTVTRYRIRLLCMVARLDGPRDASARWVPLEELAKLPLPVTTRKFANVLKAAERE